MYHFVLVKDTQKIAFVQNTEDTLQLTFYSKAEDLGKTHYCP